MKKWTSVFLTLVFLFMTALPIAAEPEEGTDTATDTEQETQTEYTQLYITMTVEQYSDGTFDVSLVDNQGGPVIGWPVILEIDGEEVSRIETDAYGDAYFDYGIPSDAQSASVTAYSGAYDVYYFNGCTEYLEIPSAPTTEEPTDPPTTTTLPPSTEAPTDAPTTAPTDAPTTEPSDDVTTTTDGDAMPTNDHDEDLLTTTTVTESTVVTSLLVSPLTTAVKGDNVLIGVDVDKGVLTVSGLSESTVQSKACMQMSKTLYETLVSTTSSTIHLQMIYNEAAADRETLLAAKNADKAFSSYDDSSVIGFAVDTSLVYVDGDSRVPLDVADDRFTIEFPVPTTMKNSEKIAVAVCTTDGLSTLQEIKPINGVLSFTVQRFQTLAIIGFGTAETTALGVQMPWYLLVMIIGGVVLVIGGVVLLILVGLRRKKLTDEADDIEEKTDLEQPDALMMDETPAEAVVLDMEEPTETIPEEPQAHPVSETGVSPTEQVVSQRVEPIREEAAQPSLTADDLLDEVMNDLDNLDSE